MACCPLPLRKKVARTRAPPARLSLCSQTLSERAVRVYLVAEEGRARQRRHESASAGSGGALTGAVPCTGGARLRVAGGTVECEGVLRTHGRLSRFTHPTDPTEARGGIVGSLE